MRISYLANSAFVVPSGEPGHDRPLVAATSWGGEEMFWESTIAIEFVCWWTNITHQSLVFLKLYQWTHTHKYTEIYLF